MLVTTVLVIVMACEVLLFICDNISIIILIIIQFSSILIYLHANITAQRQITKLARVKKRNSTLEQGNLYDLNSEKSEIRIYVHKEYN
jgi:signal transduction histidine kinase